MYKVKNITKDSRQFREHKNTQSHFLRPSEEVIISNPPINNRPDVFKVTNLEKKKNEEFEEPKKSERRNK